MKATIDGKLYDAGPYGTNDIACVPEKEYLYQTKGGDFFLVKHTHYIDGKEVDPDEPLPPELQPSNAVAERKKRLRVTHKFIPLSSHEALLWSVRTQIPLPLRGYLLDLI